MISKTAEEVALLSWNDLKWMLESDTKKREDRDPLNLANIEMAKRIVNNIERPVNYYLSVMNAPLIQKLKYKYEIEDAESELWLFLAEPFLPNEKHTPTWHRVSLYSGENKSGERCRLYSYTNTIASRHFYKQLKKKIEGPGIISIEECLNYEKLSGIEIYEENDSYMIEVARNAFKKLREVHQKTIELLIFDKIPSLQAFDILKNYMNPRLETMNGLTKEEYFETLTTIQKQNRVALLKGQALDRFTELIKDEVNSGNYDK